MSRVHLQLSTYSNPMCPFLDLVPQVMFRLLSLFLSGATAAILPFTVTNSPVNVADSSVCPVCRDYSALIITYANSQPRISFPYPPTIIRSCVRAAGSPSNTPCSDGKVCKIFNAWRWTEVDHVTYEDEAVTQIGCYYSSETCGTEFAGFQCSAFLYSSILKNDG